MGVGGVSPGAKEEASDIFNPPLVVYLRQSTLIHYFVKRQF